MKTEQNNIITAAMALLKEFGYFVDNIWHVRDVHFICQQNEYPALTDQEAMAVLELANQHFDGEVGLSWPQLEKAAAMYFERKNILEKLCSEA